ncbi:MAG: hypothetical protein A3F74_12530 [Betaproteobacteria bacterium RIFCSPLOWO2_12_FULL_62_58]|nr:MAG: hypothetical protein A3F74_12530 [Betaproteobacteria bacterium RIFCSPLOWO2_12_FULL_62_58]
MEDTFLHDVIVIEFGDRLATGLCGGLLQRLGADVTVIEPPQGDAMRESKWPHRALLGAGKRGLVVDLQVAEDVEVFRCLLQRADVVLTSSDWRPHIPPQVQSLIEAAAIVCDVSAFGTSGPLSGERYTDSMMQAFAGLMDTTGMPDQEPMPTSIPITECTAAVFAAAGVLAAVRGGRASGAAQRVEVAMFDTALTMLSTFLPKHFTGESPQRMGNRHPSMSPWNAYHARDGWLLLCSASDDMWGRVCEVIGRPELKRDPRFSSMGGRVEHADKADAAIEPWIASHTVGQCLKAFNAASVPSGPVYTIAEVLSDRSIRARGAVCSVRDPQSGKDLLVPGRLVHGFPAQGRAPIEGLASVRDSSLRGKRSKGCGPVATTSPHLESVLAGVRVLEMGNYTTAPLAARNLGAFGAYVVKIEPQSGELSRASPPYSDGQSYFCTLSNSDKRSVAIDLRAGEGQTLFRNLLSRADVFVENMKPGVLERFGFGPQQIASINPRLVYCSVSGYGANSPLADRPAMDTTIQGMAGIMDLTRRRGVPFKVGVSISDILGGQFALVAVLAGLEYRSRTGTGQFIDLSMQELSAWLTQFQWNESAETAAGRLLRCRDGYVYVVSAPAARGADETGPHPELEERHAGMTKAEVAADLTARGIRCAPVNSVSEVASHAHTRARDLIVRKPSSNGKVWPLLASPIRLSPFPAVVRRALGAVGEDLQEVLRDWELQATALEATPR